MDSGPSVSTDSDLHETGAGRNMLPAPASCATPGCQGKGQGAGRLSRGQAVGIFPSSLSSHALPCVLQPENLLVWDGAEGEEQVRICDFGNAQELTLGEPQYCQYGTPEFVAPEIVNQTPVSGVTDIW